MLCLNSMTPRLFPLLANSWVTLHWLHSLECSPAHPHFLWVSLLTSFSDHTRSGSKHFSSLPTLHPHRILLTINYTIASLLCVYGSVSSSKCPKGKGFAQCVTHWMSHLGTQKSVFCRDITQPLPHLEQSAADQIVSLEHLRCWERVTSHLGQFRRRASHSISPRCCAPLTQRCPLQEIKLVRHWKTAISGLLTFFLLGCM